MMTWKPLKSQTFSQARGSFGAFSLLVTLVLSPVVMPAAHAGFWDLFSLRSKKGKCDDSLITSQVENFVRVFTHHGLSLDDRDVLPVNDTFQSGLPRETYELMLKLEIIRPSKSVRTRFGNRVVSFDRNPLLSMKDIFTLLNQESARRFKQVFPNSKEKPQRLVLAFEEKRSKRIVLYDLERDRYYNDEGGPYEFSVGEQLEPAHTMSAASFFRVVGHGFSPVASTAFLTHDLLGHFSQFFRFPETTLTYRKAVLEAAEQPALEVGLAGDLRKTAEGIRALFMDEYNVFTFYPAVKERLKEFPDRPYSTREWQEYLQLSILEGTITPEKLAQKVLELCKARDEIFKRFGGGVSDGRNDASGIVDIFRSTPYGKLGKAGNHAKDLLGSPKSDKAMEGLVTNFGYFLAAVFNPIGLEELLSESFTAPKIEAEREAHRKTASYRYFLKIYGDDEPDTYMKDVFVDLKDAEAMRWSE